MTSHADCGSEPARGIGFSHDTSFGVTGSLAPLKDNAEPCFSWQAHQIGMSKDLPDFAPETAKVGVVLLFHGLQLIQSIFLSDILGARCKLMLKIGVNVVESVQVKSKLGEYAPNDIVLAGS